MENLIKNYKLYHGSPVSNLKNLKIMEKENGDMNELGYGIYVAHKGDAESYMGPNGALYQVLARLHNELKSDAKTMSREALGHIALYLITSKSSDADNINQMFSDFFKTNQLKTVTNKDDVSTEEMTEALSYIYSTLSSDKELFDKLYKYDNEVFWGFTAAGYTHTFIHYNGEDEWCLLPSAIISVVELKNDDKK